MDNIKVKADTDIGNGMKDIERVVDGDVIVAIILRSTLSVSGVEFFTPSEFSQQLGILVHPKGKTVKPHKHKQIKRDIIQTQEVLLVVQGKVKIDLYSADFKQIATVVLGAGDTILLSSGGHGIEIIEDARIIEIKQGPYAGAEDKDYLENYNDSRE